MRIEGESVLIDAANEHDKLLQLCKALNVRQVVETHGHWDHIQAVEAVRDAGIQVAVTAADAAMLPSYDQILEDQSVLEIGRLRIRPSPPRATPRDPCASPSRAPRCCSPGTRSSPVGRATPRSRTPTSAPSSVDRRRLFAAFDPDTIVLPGHGAGTTIGAESPHLEEWVERGLVTVGRCGPQTAVDGRRGSRTNSISGGSPLTTNPPGTSVPTSMVTLDPASGIPSTFR